MRRAGVGEVSQDPRRVVEILKGFQDETIRRKLNKNIKRASRPAAALEIAKIILSHA
jgi:hypothetical protein